MKQKNYPIFAKEGTVHIIIALLFGFGALFFVGWWSLPIWLLVLFVIQFFRDPARQITKTPGVVVAPASGQVILVGQRPNPYLDGIISQQVSIFMNVFSVHSNLIPIAGTVRQCWYQAGQFFNAALDKASSKNERNAVWIQTEQGHDVVVVQIAGLIARRIFCYVDSGDLVKTGERYGFIRFGSRVDLYLPLDTHLKVSVGDWIHSGCNMIGIVPPANV